MFKKFENTTFKIFLLSVPLVCQLPVVLVFVCWMNLISYITTENLIKTKIYIFTYLLWNTNLLSSFSSLFSSHYLDNVFFCFYFFFVFCLNFFKPKLFCQYFFETLRKQQARGIQLNRYAFSLITFTKLCSLLATFFKVVMKNLILRNILPATLLRKWNFWYFSRILVKLSQHPLWRISFSGYFWEPV